MSQNQLWKESCDPCPYSRQLYFLDCIIFKLLLYYLSISGQPWPNLEAVGFTSEHKISRTSSSVTVSHLSNTI